MSEAHATGEGHHPALLHHFDDLDQQRAASELGMWVFLVTEILFFGGFFAAYAVYDHLYPAAFHEGSHHLDVRLGGINTVVLIASSLTMALAVRTAQTGGKRKTLIGLLGLTLALGSTFLVIKGFEYHHKWVEHLIPGPNFVWPGEEARHLQLFYSLYFGMTGMHALHMVIGAGLLLSLIYRSMKNQFSPEYFTPVEVTGLYWHFVDIVWIFLFPLLYLLGRH